MDNNLEIEQQNEISINVNLDDVSWGGDDMYTLISGITAGNDPMLFGRYIFRLRSNVYVYRNKDAFNRNVSDFVTFKNYDIADIDRMLNDEGYSFIGTGYRSGDEWQDGPKHTVKIHRELNDDENNIVWEITTDVRTSTSTTNNGLLITYLRDGMDNDPMHLWFCEDPTILRCTPYFNGGGYVNYFYFTDPTDTNKVLGCVKFNSIRRICPFGGAGSNFPSTSGSTDPNITPFHVEEVTNGGIKRYYLCFNTDEETLDAYLSSSDTTYWNGRNWECSIYIFDNTNPYFYEHNNIVWKTLELPSVYKPFYMRGLVLVDTVLSGNTHTHPVYVTGNIYNGIGLWNTNTNKYDIGTLTVKINDIVDNIDITGNTPTLLSGYEDSVHTFWTFSTSGGVINRLEDAVETLDYINVNLAITEAAPATNTSNNLFMPNRLAYQNVFSFYDIQSTCDVTHQLLKIFTFSNVTGNSSNGVQYFFVSEYFYHNMIECMIPTTDETPGSCNTKQYYELYPNEYSNTNGRFYSFYGASYVVDYTTYNNNTDYTAIKPTETSIIVRINGDIEPGETFGLYTADADINPHDPKWHLIGIYDPLVNLINAGWDTFKSEFYDGTVLTPQTNFITTMVLYDTEITHIYD